MDENKQTSGQEETPAGEKRKTSKKPETESMHSKSFLFVFLREAMC